MLETNIELTMQDGSARSTAEFAGKLVMVVNVASRCGLTPQYEALEELQKKYQDRGFTVLGVPSGSFKQELKSDEAISEYCSTTWGITFPMTEKSEVNGRKRHELYKHLTKSVLPSGTAPKSKTLTVSSSLPCSDLAMLPEILGSGSANV